jgi:acyl-CoA thioester hydrolase
MIVPLNPRFERARGRRVARVHGFGFHTEILVRFAETDAQGIAHHSNYVVWFEAARVAYLAEFAGGYQAIRDVGLESLVLEVQVRYRQPARFDDRLHVHARVGEIKGARFRFDYAVTRGDELLADGWTSHACVDARTFRPTRIPHALVAAIATAEGSSSSSSTTWSSSPLS